MTLLVLSDPEAPWFELDAREQTPEVGKLNANPWGLCDAMGNLW